MKFGRSPSQIADDHSLDNVIVEARDHAQQLLGLVPRKPGQGER